MKATELRIGNAVFVDWVDAGRKIETCYGIHQGPDQDEPMMSTVTKGYWVPVSKVQPIPLTEEWLVKFGFNLLKTGYYYTDFLICECYNEGEVKVSLCQGYDPDIDLPFIVSVHQLQNLYFDLTGKELKTIQQ